MLAISRGRAFAASLVPGTPQRHRPQEGGKGWLTRYSLRFSSIVFSTETYDIIFKETRNPLS